MAEKVTVMILKVDFQGPRCYKKVKKILCKFPQIRDQIFDEKGNKVTITVVCCNPEKIRDKLCCKGAKVITSIEIIEPPKPKPKQNPEKPPDPPKPSTPDPKPPPPEPVRHPEPFLMYPQCYLVPVRTCCGPCSEGYGGGPCYGYGVPPPPQPCYDGYHGYGYGNNRPCHVTRCDYYFCEKNPQACSIM